MMASFTAASSNETEWVRFTAGSPSNRFYLNFHLCPVQRVGKEEAVLGLEPLATIPELRRAYRRLAKANHPDLGSASEREARTKRMAELNVAYKAAMERRGH